MLALCKCGIDMTVHKYSYEGDEYEDESLPPAEGEHYFDAAGTKYRCEEFINGYLCPRPAYHKQEGVECGPLTGKKLWE